MMELIQKIVRLFGLGVKVSYDVSVGRFRVAIGGEELPPNDNPEHALRDWLKEKESE